MRLKSRPVRFKLLFGPMLVFLALWSLGSPPADANTTPRRPPVLFFGIAPHQACCRRLAGDRIRAEILLPAGSSPALYSPPPSRVEKLRRARVYFSLGLPFEQRILERLAQQPSHPEIINLQTGNETAPHADPHTWLAPPLFIRQAEIIAATLCRLDPASCATYRANLAGIKKELKALDRFLTTALAPLAGEKVLIYHPALGWFTRAYGLEQLAIEEEGKPPRGRRLSRLLLQARGLRIKAILIEPQFDHRSAARIARQLGWPLIEFDPLASNYIANLEKLAAILRKAAGLPAPEGRAKQ